MGRIGQIAWNKGLTKDTDPRVALNGKNESKTKKQQHKTAWNKGLTKDDPRVAKYVKSSRNTKIRIHYHKGHPYYGGGPSIGHEVSEKTKKILAKKSFEQSMRMTQEERTNRALNAIKYIKKSGTDIEIKLEEMLKRLNLNYETQKNISGICKPDFFISPNICIFADGDYHHKLSDVVDRDNKINKKLKINNYIILRFWGNDIKKHPEIIYEEIYKIIPMKI
jgi:DNA mismatch endonuclease, patch repair protein